MSLCSIIKLIPAVSTERHEGQTALIAEVAYLEVFETITHSHRFLHFGRRYCNALVARVIARSTELHRSSLVEHSVLTSHLKALNIFPAIVALRHIVE